MSWEIVVEHPLKPDHNDKISRSDYLEWTDRWLKLVSQLMRDDGSLFLNMGGKPSDPTPPYDVLAVARKHFKLQNQILWVKSISIDMEQGPTTFGHYKPINSPRFLNDTWEFVFHLTKTGDVPLDRVSIGVPFMDASNLKRGTRGKNGDLRCRGNSWHLPPDEGVWHVPYETIKSRSDDRPHPATFPAKLAEMCYRLHGVSKIKRSFDPFSGLGNSAIGAIDAGISHVGIELDPTDHGEARQRVAEAATAFVQRTKVKRADLPSLFGSQ